MGDHCKAAGFASVREFVVALTQSEAAHLDAFVAFVGSDKAMAEALRTKDAERSAASASSPYASSSLPYCSENLP